ncbi:MAG: zf-HC2 domain-containing protein [Planctomycetes bacterium]|nr:zf-HC2 domain-containing protein [Planctomycetota bacterium]
MSDCTEIQERLSAYLDQELTQQESQRIAVHLRECPRCRGVCEDFARLRQGVKRLKYPAPSEAEWRKTMARFTFTATRGVGWLLWLGGAIVLVGYGIYEFATDSTIAALERVAVLGLILGAVLVFLTVLVERAVAYQHDKFKDVQE